MFKYMEDQCQEFTILILNNRPPPGKGQPQHPDTHRREDRHVTSLQHKANHDIPCGIINKFKVHQRAVRTLVA